MITLAREVLYSSVDIVKVRLQTQAGSTAFSVARRTWTQEGPLAFYKVGRT